MTNWTRTIPAAASIVLALSVSACSDNQMTAPPPSPTSATSSVTYTLSGVVSEATSTGLSPIGGAQVEVAVCPPSGGSATTSAKVVTETNGTYRVSGMCSGTTYVWVTKAGYRTNPPRQCDGDCLFATISGDTRFDIELVRQ